MFIEEKKKESFNELGYFKAPLLKEKDLEKLYNLYETTAELCEINKPFYTSIWSNNIDFKKKVDTQIKQILMPKLEDYLKDFKGVFANFMVKKSGDYSSLPPHQDWSFLNEELADSITVWIPLIDVDERNGAMQVCPKSNLLKNYIRPRFQNSPFASDLNYIKNNLMKSVEMKKGEALFINSRTIHSSPNNLSLNDRIAVSIVIAPQESEIIHYVMEKDCNDKAYKLNVKPDFFTKYSCFDYPKIESFKKTEKLKPQPNLTDLLNVLK